MTMSLNQKTVDMIENLAWRETHLESPTIMRSAGITHLCTHREIIVSYQTIGNDERMLSNSSRESCEFVL